MDDTRSHTWCLNPLPPARPILCVQIIAFLCSVPVMVATEGAVWSKFMTLATTNWAFQVGKLVKIISLFPPFFLLFFPTF